MTDEKCRQFLDRVERLDPYWQKFEWYDIKADDPEFHKELLKYRDKLNDRPEKT